MIKDSETTEQESSPPSHLDSLEESLRKCNLSFSFNFDFEDVKSDSSSDSESANLQIDVSEVDNYEASNRKKRESVEEVSSVLNEMEEEIERQLDAKAAKTNLTATNVKNILRHVITNEHVMAMVQKQLHDKEDDVLFEPKLTRAKAKELAAAQVDIPWPITPIKKPASEVQVLIEEELSEDSSDEEYNPEHDKQSDDERETENYANSDAESHPVVSANGSDTARSEKQLSTEVQYDPEGIFKIPETPHVPEEVDSIGQRTRSKLCLSETSLEQIEQAFVPPDITTDMYDWDGEIDEDWDNFLKEFTRPLTQDPVADDDPEADPEYNILEDEEIELLDKEELRADKAVKVTRKELNNLIAELFEFTDSFSKQQQETSKKKKVVENLQLSPENNTLTGVIPSFSTSAEPEIPKVINFEQQQLLATQLRQHIQLAAQHFVMTYMRPQLHAQSCTCKQNLLSLKYLSSGPHSAFNAANLPDALKLISNWESKLSDEKFRENYLAELADKRNKMKVNTGTSKAFYAPRFNPKMEKLFVESAALMYPQLLPHVLFSAEAKISIRQAYTKPEEFLIAIGLEQFLPLVTSTPKKFKGKKFHMMDTLQLISQYLLPWRDPRALRFHIQRRRCMKDGNPIQHYFQKGTAPKIRHYMMATYDLKAPKDQSSQLLPLHWQKYLKSTKYGTKNWNCLTTLNSYQNLKGDYIVPKNHPLRNPIVNIMSKKITKRNTPRQTDINVNSVRNITPIAESPHASSARLLSLPTLSDSSNMSPPNQTSGETRCTETNLSNSIVLDTSRKDTSETVEKPESPQVRRTTPRLAKTKSAQNMKLMAQVLGPKGISSNCSNLKTRDKSDMDKSKSSVLPKVDDEDEIAELMLASTTIKRDAVSRKKAKEARELENIKRLLESENAASEEERESKFAASYFQKLHLTLEPHDTEILKTVIKLYIEYNEKLEEINKVESNFLTEKLDKDTLVIELYQNVCDKLRVYPELCSDFLLFLSPHQAAMIDKSVEYTMLQKMSKFVNVAQIYFAKQPSRIAKMMHAIRQLSSDTRVTLESVYGVMAPLLKGHPLIMDLFLQVLPTAKPPESLFASHLFENLVCPIGPHEKNKIYTEDAPELYENIDLPVLPIQDDPYGGENCKCQCHNTHDGNTKTTIEHCISCGIRYLNGRIYLQTTEGLRPAKVIFPGADEEKLENMARVSLKTADKFVSPAVPKRRRRSSKNESTNDEPWHKSMPPKNSPIKETEQLEKITAKSKKTVKNVPLKTAECKKPLKRFPNFDDEALGGKRIRKREKRMDSPDEKHECGNPSSTESVIRSEPNQNTENDPANIVDNNYSESEIEEVSDPIAEVSMEGVQKLIESSPDPTCSIQNNRPTDGNITTNNKPWSRKEDMILLQSIKEEYSENSLVRVSEALRDRTLDQVKERCQVLLTLLEKMV